MPGFERRAESVLEAGGPDLALHLRTRAMNGAEYVELARRLSHAAASTGSLLVVNSRVDVALAAGAHAVQLGRGSLASHEVRQIEPKLRVGISVHSARAAGCANDCDWSVLGHLFETPSHPGETGLGLPSLRQASLWTSVPIVAIGGIALDDVERVRRAGAWGVAVLAGIWRRDDPAAATRDYLSYDAAS